MVVAAGLVLLIAALGTALTLWVDVPLRLEERIPLGVVVGFPFLPIAIIIYWVSNNVWSFGQ